MADSFQLHTNPPAEAVRTVAVTGAAGRIGQSFVELAAGRFDLRLLEHPEADARSIEGGGERADPAG